MAGAFCLGGGPTPTGHSRHDCRICRNFYSQKNFKETFRDHGANEVRSLFGFPPIEEKVVICKCCEREFKSQFIRNVPYQRYCDRCKYDGRVKE